MAKNPTLTVGVNSQQFQQFARQFAAFSGQMKQLNQQFVQINATLQKTTVTARALNATFQVGMNLLKGMGSAVGKITGHFLKWSIIIGGVTTLLGMGGGLFGIDRLAQSILTKRRQVLGLGGSANYGRVQASTIYNQSYLDNPMGSLQSVQRGLGGSSDEMRGLAAAGIPFGTKMSPTEVLDKVVDKTMEIVKRAAPGTELMVTKAYGLDKFLSESDIMRMTTEEGRKEILEKRELSKAHEKELQISPKALKGWSDLELQLQIAGASMQTIFGEKLKDLAKPLGRLSASFSHLIKVLMDSPIVQRLMKKLADWIDKLAAKLENLQEKDIQDFINKMREYGLTLTNLKNALEFFITALDKVTSALSMIWNFLKTVFPWIPAVAIYRGVTSGNMPWNPIGGPAQTGPANQSTAPSTTPPTAQSPSTAQPSTTTQPPTTQAPQAPAAPAAPNAPAPTSTAGSKSAASFLSPKMGGGFAGGGAGATDSRLFTSGPFSGVTSGITAPAATAPPSSGAAKGFTPPPSAGGGGLSGRLPSLMGTDPGLKPGPLSMNNWQMNRTASLVVRNVPGSNIFMSAQGMTG